MRCSPFPFAPSPVSFSRLMGPVLGLTLLLATTQPAAAQVDDVGDLVRGGTTDAQTLVTAYLGPGVTGFGRGLNTGWTGAAKPHGVLGFHLRVGATLSRVPNGDRSFTLTGADLETFTLENSELGRSPTIAGDDDATTYRLQLPSGDVIEMPEGTGFSFTPAPVIEAGVGVIRDTEVMLRLVPPVDFGDDYGEVGLFGFGVKHGLNQWLPGGALLPVDLSAMVNYTRFNLDANLDDNSNQTLEWDTNAWAITGLVGKSLPILSVYAGVGVESGATEIALKGTYDIENDQGVDTSVEDPLTVDFGSNTSLRALGGARIRLGFFAIYLEGTLANYSSVTAGVGLSFR